MICRTTLCFSNRLYLSYFKLEEEEERTELRFKMSHLLERRDLPLAELSNSKSLTFINIQSHLNCNFTFKDAQWRKVKQYDTVEKSKYNMNIDKTALVGVSSDKLDHHQLSAILSHCVSPPVFQ